MKRLLIALTLLCLATPAVAYQPDEVLADPALEARARTISQGLRCLVCQNQSIDDSDAPLARDLRVLLRERLSAGETDEQAVAFITARYGDFVLLNPPMKPATWLLWFGPLALLLIGAGGIVISMRRRKAADAALPPEFTDDERRRLTALLKEDKP
ncbi:MAG TPA: cytochrome c-type biogenesis protein [Alphaproteobacteria bacterium]|nr:cytochrome c-type biogenesis protein [Alphaproteobacteria bacterium]